MFIKNLKGYGLQFEDRNRKFEERITTVEEKGDSMYFGLGMANSKNSMYEKTKDRLQEEVTYLQSHSMRNNLVFSGIPEASSESQEDAETRGFIHEKLSLAKYIVDKASRECIGWGLSVMVKVDPEYCSKVHPV
ncbi:hypothetical protein DPMN_155019 [Dreissena polymorpha]|uniref:Uncharacterized protein n=1 Tax=Dreissena polymorpha TaxID=45954 RepID=A0A9D4FM79_DREPO|nr:hypothetical protein DPMN_155019 [Dreissena polymorpha]